MQAIQLELFTEMDFQSASSTHHHAEKPATWARVISMPKQQPKPMKIPLHRDPCDDCYMKEWCSADDCSRKGYPVDLPTTRFKSLQDYIQFIKHYDWI